jgi:hypothetical protein
MSVASSVSVDELVRALERKAATLPAEIAAFIVFSGCETMIEQGPRELVGLAQVRVSENGTVVLTGSPCEEELGARTLHRVLVRLLHAAGANLPHALQRLLERPEQEVHTLRQLLDQLEATLVPLNRTASRRVLARFAREAAYPLIEPHEVDAALNSLLAEEVPANDAPGTGRKERAPRSLEPESRLQVDLLEGLDLEGEESHYLEQTISVPARSEANNNTRPSTRPSFAPGARESLRSRASQLEELGSPSGSRKLFIGFALLAVAVLIVIAAVSMREERERQERLRDEEAAAAAALVKPAQPVAGDMMVHVSEPNAQVLRFVGRAPVSVDNLPVGVAHEFVATADGHKPARVLVPANADWEASAEGARYELALQLNPSEGGHDAELELGPSRLTAQAGDAPTRRGSIRVVTTPKGARVYQLVGFSPEVKVSNVPLDVAQELLIYREGFTPVVRVLQQNDFRVEAGKRVADLTVQLAKHR